MTEAMPDTVWPVRWKRESIYICKCDIAAEQAVKKLGQARGISGWLNDEERCQGSKNAILHQS